MHVHGGLFLRPTWRCFHQAKHVDDVVVLLLELRLCKERQQALVSAVSVHNDDLLAAVSGHLVSRFLQKFQLQVSAIGNRSRLVLGFKNLTKVIFREYDGILLLGRSQSTMANVQ